MNDTLKRKVQPLHNPRPIFCSGKIVVFPVAAVLSGGLVEVGGGGGGQKEGSEGAPSHDSAI